MKCPLKVGQVNNYCLNSYDLSVSLNDIVAPLGRFEGFLYNYSNEGFFNKPVSRIRYEWSSNEWQNVDTQIYYYSDAPSGISNVSIASMSVYPNPVSESFSINGMTKSTVVTILDMTGKMVLQQTILPEEMVVASHLPSGVYFVRFNGETVKMIKK